MPPNCRAFFRTASAFTAETDWLLEESGFELLVPLWMRVSLGERTEITRVRERCSRIRQWTPIGFEWRPSASAAAEERRGVGTNIGKEESPAAEEERLAA
jgi:hypothetical protein